MASIFSGRAGRQAAMYQAGQIQKGIDDGTAALDQGYDRASEAYGRAGQTLGDLAGSYQAGSNLYQDALGVNGADGSVRARSAYTTSPGYTFNLDQGLQALSRARAANGTLNSGGADADAMKFATGLASQDYNAWLSNLSGLDTKRYGATTGEAGTFGALGSAALSTGSNKANLNFQGNSAIGQAGANGLMAGQQAAANRFGAMMGGLNLLGSAVGSVAGGGSGGLGSLFSIFGGGGGGSGGLSLSGFRDDQWV